MSNAQNLFHELSAGIDEYGLVETLRAFIAIPSRNPFDREPCPGYREQEMGEAFYERMHALGLRVGWRHAAPGRPNVWGFLKGSGEGPSLMLSGHLDTVGTENYPDALEAKVRDGRVYGRGSCDMKAALAAYLEVARLIREGGVILKGDLILTGLSDEEHLMIGSRDLGQEGPKADFGIIGEPTDLAICPAHKGQLGITIRTFGKAVHSSRPERGVNAINAMAKVIDAFGDYDAELGQREAHHLCGHGRFSPGVIRGGTIVSTVPDCCELEVDRRTLPGESLEAVSVDFLARLDALAAADPDFRYEISDPTLEVPPLDVPQDTPVVRSVIDGYRAVTGRDGQVTAFYGGSDAPHFGFPTLIFGPGAVEQAHSLDEYVKIEDMLVATKVYLWAALDLLA